MSIAIKVLSAILSYGILAWAMLAWYFWDHRIEELLHFSAFSVLLTLLFICVIRKKSVFWKLCLLSLLLLTWFMRTAKHDRNWVDYQSKLPEVRIEGQYINIKNLRHDLRYREQGELQWLEKKYDLNELTEVRFALVNFSDWRGLAHVFLSFNFNNRAFLSVSGEIRREQNESYSPFKGLFKHYEMMIVLGSEEDVIVLRLFEHQDPLRFYPLNISKENAKLLLLNLMKDCQELEKEARYYNTLNNNCATLLQTHFKQIYGKSYAWDFRLIFPGYTDQIAWDEGMIKANGDLEELRNRYLINEKVDLKTRGPAFSMKIRQP